MEQTSSLTALGQAFAQQQLFEKQSPEALKTLRTSAIVESTESSNRIEGVVAPKQRFAAIVAGKSEPRNRSEQEILGYRGVLEMVHSNASEIPITANSIRQLHKEVYRYHPNDGGNWKPVDNEIVEKNTAGEIVRVRFKPVAAVATPQAMADIERLYRQATTDGCEPLVVAPLLILDFLCVHPFADGNGRVSRLLTLLALYHAGFSVGRYISLERLIENTQSDYYRVLEASSQRWHDGKHDPHPWLEYFWAILLAAYQEFAERVGKESSGRGNKTMRIRAAIERRVGAFRMSDLERDCPGVSREMIRVVLNELRDHGRAEVTGRGRGAEWHKLEPKD